LALQIWRDSTLLKSNIMMKCTVQSKRSQLQEQLNSILKQLLAMPHSEHFYDRLFQCKLSFPSASLASVKIKACNPLTISSFFGGNLLGACTGCTLLSWFTPTA